MTSSSRRLVQPTSRKASVTAELGMLTLFRLAPDLAESNTISLQAVGAWHVDSSAKRRPRGEDWPSPQVGLSGQPSTSPCAGCLPTSRSTTRSRSPSSCGTTEWPATPCSWRVHDGELIGCAGLDRDTDCREGDNALTALRCDWRGRGVAVHLMGHRVRLTDVVSVGLGQTAIRGSQDVSPTSPTGGEVTHWAGSGVSGAGRRADRQVSGRNKLDDLDVEDMRRRQRS